MWAVGIAGGESRSQIDREAIVQVFSDASSKPQAPGAPRPTFHISAFNHPESGLRASVAPARPMHHC